MVHSSPKLASRMLVLAFAVAAAVVVVTTPCAAQNAAADFVNPHNVARASVGVGPVAWDATVAAYAQSYANQRRADCKLVHSTGGTYGENIFWGSAGKAWAAADAVNAWVSEKQYYNYTTNTCAAGKICGHYTQVVWRASTAVGCGHVVCDNAGGVFIICSYNPPGNFQGQRPY